VARNEAYVNRPPEAVWRVLEDPYCYPRWVVGSDRTVEADADWPAPGSKFKVRLAFGHHDYTHSRALDPGRRIVLDAAGGPMGAARVTITLEGDDTGTRVSLVEDPPAPLRWVPPLHWAIRLRNVESLRRFKRLVEATG
jgi:uncharacterized protein YndB with AHSA1/START domain